MNIIEIIDKKKQNIELNEKEIYFFINNYVEEKIPDYQISALLMAIRLNSMSPKETAILTKAIVESGAEIKYNVGEKIVVDKHSTGGVGDKTSLVLVPLLASLDFAVSKMSGRGLGYTGGTIDKLESLEGFNVSLTEEEIHKQVAKIGCVIAGQTEKIVPADKKLYALRDVTSTVDSIPLIASSIMSKKIALGAEIIALDVKYGSGAFMQTKEDAVQLAKTMCEIGKALDRKTIAFITNMEEPLGGAVGNAIEVQEAIDTLQNKKNGELRELCSIIASEFLKIRDESLNQEDAFKIINEKFENGEVYNKFKDLIKLQGAKENSENNLSIAKNIYEYKAKNSGYISKLKALNIGKATMFLGAGRKTKDDLIDLEVGLDILAKIGEKVELGDTIINIYYNDENKLNECLNILESSIEITKNECSKINLVEDIIK